MNDLKLYVWEGVLTDYTDGVMFALASNVKEAREKVMDNYNADYDGRFKTSYKDLLNGTLKELKGKPKVYKNAVGFYLFGGA